MVFDSVVEVFRRLGHTWTLTNGRVIEPEAEDVEKVLDHAAGLLYNEEVGTRLNVGSLIVEKREHDHDVYVYVGSYK